MVLAYQYNALHVCINYTYCQVGSGNSPVKIANTYIIAHVTASFQKAKM